MVRAGDLVGCVAGSLLLFLGLSKAAQSESDIKRPFPFDRFELAQNIGSLASEKGVRGTFYRGNCEEIKNADPTRNYCEYSFLSLRYRVWWTTGSGKVTSISASPHYNSRFAIDNNAFLSLSFVIASIEADFDDEKTRNIVDQLAAAGRALDGSATVYTPRARYDVQFEKAGYSFRAIASGE